MNLYEDLKYRGLIFQETDEKGIAQYLATPGKAVYIGFDPTADSLHIGSLLQILTLRRCQLAGLKTIPLVGGATGLIGDPSGKAAERSLNTSDIVQQWSQKVRSQLERFLDFSGSNAAVMANNLDWTQPMSAIEFLRDVGKHFTVNWMLAKDSVKSRIGREEGGISYTEFSYMILQAYDFYHLAKSHECLLQIGGSDQWGNITAGIDLIGKKLSKQAYGLTSPLVMTTSGVKFGKTEAGAIWLDAAKTSPYAFYQYWLNVEDADVVRFLKFFTFLDAATIDGLEGEVTKNPEQRHAQKRLAGEVTKLVHGEQQLQKALQASEALFGGGDLSQIDLPTLLSATQSAPTVEFASAADVPALAALMVAAGLCPSKGQANQMITAGGVYINNERAADPTFKPSAQNFLHGKLLMLRRGKKNYAIVKLKG